MATWQPAGERLGHLFPASAAPAQSPDVDYEILGGLGRLIDGD